MASYASEGMTTDEIDEIVAMLEDDPNFEAAPASEYDEGVVEVTIPGKILRPKKEDEGDDGRSAG